MCWSLIGCCGVQVSHDMQEDAGRRVDQFTGSQSGSQQPTQIASTSPQPSGSDSRTGNVRRAAAQRAASFMTAQEEETKDASAQAKLGRPEGPTPPCPRCAAGPDMTKFCYYNNGQVAQPRYYCRVRAPFGPLHQSVAFGPDEAQA